MIVSYLHNFIFIKTKKTAGSSVEAVLAASCGPDDIVTMSSSGRRLWEGAPTIAARNYNTDPAMELERKEEIARGQLKRSRVDKKTARSEGKFYNHMSAARMQPLLDPTFWKNAYKLTVERHPYEKAVSQAYFALNAKDLPEEEFPPFLDSVVRKGAYAGNRHWMIGDQVAVDEFIRHENLRADLERIGARLGIAIPAELPYLKGSMRLDRRPAREILSDEQKAIVYQKAAKDFAVLGYER